MLEIKLFKQKFWRALARPWVKIMIVLSWPLGATMGLLIINHNDFLHPVVPYLSVFGIVISTLSVMAVTVYFQTLLRWGVPAAVSLSLHQLINVLCIAYFSSTWIALRLMYGWTLFDMWHPQHVLPTREIYPAANLSALGFVMSAIACLSIAWRKRDYRLSTTVEF